jgi:hypothetical protein
MAYTVPSRYQPIWDALKTNRNHKAELVAPVVLHRRIIKAVIKRKDVDLSFKFECAEQHRKARLGYRIEGTKITFYLTFIPYYNSTGAY